METINASYFKARCLAILDRVRDTGERIVILKRGRPVAELGPPSRTHTQYPQAELKGTVTVIGDIIGPALPADHWDSLAGASMTPDPTEDPERRRARWKGGE